MTTNQSPEGLAALVEARDGQDYEGEVHLTSEEGRAIAAALRDHTGAGDGLLRDCRQHLVNHRCDIFQHTGGVEDDLEATIASIDAHLSRTPDREPFDRKAVLEEAARAIAERGWDGSPGYKWANISEAEQDEYREDARAALAALSEHPRTDAAGTHERNDQ